MLPLRHVSRLIQKNILYKMNHHKVALSPLISDCIAILLKIILLETATILPHKKSDL